MPDLAIKLQDKRIGDLAIARAAAESTEKDKEEGRGARAKEEESEGAKGSEAQDEGEGGGQGKSGPLPHVEAVVAAAVSPTGKEEAESVEFGEGEKHTAHTVLEVAEAVSEGLEEAAGSGEEGKAVATADYQGAMDEPGAAASSSSKVGQEACPGAARGECMIGEEPAGGGGPGRCDGDGGDGDAGTDVCDAGGEAATPKMQKKKKSAKKKK